MSYIIGSVLRAYVVFTQNYKVFWYLCAHNYACTADGLTFGRILVEWEKYRHAVLIDPFRSDSADAAIKGGVVMWRYFGCLRRCWLEGWCLVK